ncbi:hypothetical protein [Leptolyngbya sp. FACHB-261]|uniref:hypothetical protein n=1 Tax=Leptolyngbya sp. FACHB-261 TaxID=2692806 RepID=UPI001685BFA2|nr:hypothetical protein [Leptolyngbya sp. FACHB-261]MBD2102768.1 hypothetical protein [Leptolyngbya sp. FACHB-261]
MTASTPKTRTTQRKSSSQPVEESLNEGKDNVQIATSAAPGALQRTSGAQAIRVYEPRPLPNNRPVFPTTLEILETSDLPEGRPIAVAGIQVAGTLLGNRPIAVSGIEIVKTLGNRPVVASNLQVSSEAEPLPNNRPVAPNLLPDAELMGYLD